MLQAGYTLGLGQEMAGVNYALGVLPLLALHCLPYSTRGGFLLFFSHGQTAAQINEDSDNPCC